MINDGHGGTVSQVVTVKICGTNDAPDIRVLAGDSAAETINETNSGLTKSGTLTVTDVDLSDVVSLSVQSVAASGTTSGLGLTNAQLKAMLSIASPVAANPGDTNNTTWTFNSGTQAFNYLNPGQSLVLTYTIKASDGHGGTDTQTVKITIKGTAENTPPTSTNDL